MAVGLYSRKHLLLLILFFICCVSVTGQLQVGNCTQTRGSTSTLEFLFMTSFGEAFNSSGSAVGMMMALDRINSNNSILPGYNLTYSAIVDSQCDRAVSLSAFFDNVDDPCRNFIAIIGSGCSVATEPIAELGYFWGFSHISYSSNAAVFSNRIRFKSYFQIYSSQDVIILGVAGIIDYYGWNRVGVITEEETLFTESERLLELLLPDVNFTTQTFENPVDTPEIFPENGRIFFLNTYENKARQVICEAYHNGLFGQYYVWILYGWYSEEWWKIVDTENTHRCTIDQLEEVIDSSLAVQQYPINENLNKKAVGDLTYNEYLTEYSQRVANSAYDETFVGHLAYDATWALAFALDEVNGVLENGTTGPDGTIGHCGDDNIFASLEEWIYTRNTTASCLIHSALMDTDFEGLSGNVQFDVNGTRLSTLVRIYQYRENMLYQIARWEDDVFMYINDETNDTVFPDGIPSDGTPVDVITSSHPALISVAYIAAFIGLVFCVVCVVFTIVFRNKKTVQLSTPSLNYCIVAGSVLILVSIFFRVFPSIDPTVVTIFCGISFWFSNVGIALSFGAVLTKMWRIYYIFFSPLKKKKTHKLTDLHLLGIVFGLTLVIVLILLIGTAVPQTRPNAYLREDLEFPPALDESGTQQYFFYYACFTSSADILFILIFVYFGIMQIVAIVLIFQTKRVKIKALNDSKTVAVIVYISTLALVEIAVVAFASSGYPNITEALVSSGLLVSAYAILTLTFIPQMIRLYKDPKGHNIFNHASSSASIKIGKRGVLTVVKDEEKVASLKLELDELNTLIEQKKKENSPDIQKIWKESTPDTTDTQKIFKESTPSANDTYNESTHDAKDTNKESSPDAKDTSISDTSDIHKESTPDAIDTQQNSSSNATSITETIV